VEKLKKKNGFFFQPSEHYVYHLINQKNDGDMETEKLAVKAEWIDCEARHST